MGFRNPVQREGLHGHPNRHDDAGQILRLLRWRQLGQHAMRIRTARRTTAAYRGQWHGVRVERADVENACRQSERNHPMREHGSRWQQSGLRGLALLSDPLRIVFRNPVMPTAMAEYRIVRSVCLWRFEHHHGQRRSDFRGPVFVPKHRESRQLPCLAVRRGREALQNGRSWLRRERDWRRVWQTGDLEHGRVGDAYRRSGFVRHRPMLPEDHFGARWCGIRLGRHPTAVRRGVSGFRVAKHLHLPVTLDKQAETAGRERDDAHVGERTERFRDGFIRRRVVLLSTAGELDVAVNRDDASDPTQSEAVVRVRRPPRLGYGKLFHRPAATDAKIISAVHTAADRDLAVRVEGQGSMLPVHTFQQYRAFTLRQETGGHRLIHDLAVGIDVRREGRVAKSERHHADLGEMYLHSVGPMPDLPFKGYGKLFNWSI